MKADDLEDSAEAPEITLVASAAMENGCREKIKALTEETSRLRSRKDAAVATGQVDEVGIIRRPEECEEEPDKQN